MTDYKHLNESQLAKLSIDELKNVVKSMKLKRLQETKDKDREILVAKRERTAKPEAPPAPIIGVPKKSTLLKSSATTPKKVSKRISAEKRIALLEQELELAKSLDSSFSDIPNEEKRRRLAQLRRSLVREKHRQEMKQKRETERYQAPVTVNAAWKQSLRSGLYDGSAAAKKRPSSATKKRSASVAQRRKSLPLTTTPVPKKRKSVASSRPQSAHRVRVPQPAAQSSPTIQQHKRRTSSTSKSNAKIAARLRDIEDQISFLEQRLTKHAPSKRSTLSSSDSAQLRQISEQLSTMESKQSRMRHTVSSLKKNVIMIHESQSEQKMLMERLTKAVLKHRRQQQEYNDTFDKRINEMQRRSDTIEDQQHKLRVAMLDNGTEIESDSISVFSPPSDTKGSSTLLNTTNESEIAANPVKQTVSSPDFVSRYSKLKQAFHRVYGRERSGSRRDEERDESESDE